MRSKTAKEGILHALFFVIAIGLLLYNTFGLLTFPGIIGALIAIFFIFKGNFYIPAIIGILATSISFTGQYLTTFCPYCTASAICFFIGGIVSLKHTFSNMLPISIALTIILTSSVALFAATPVIEDQRTPIIESQEYYLQEISPDKALLYMSPSCRACKEVVKQFIKYDPNGVFWQPVVIPAMSLQSGENLLREAGYKGEVNATSAPPTKIVPTIKWQNQYYEGSKSIQDIIKGGQIFGNT